MKNHILRYQHWAFFFLLTLQATKLTNTYGYAIRYYIPGNIRPSFFFSRYKQQKLQIHMVIQVDITFRVILGNI